MRSSAASAAITLALALTFQTASPAQTRTTSSSTTRAKWRRVLSEKTPDPRLEEAILKTIPDYTGLNIDGEESLVRYYYNRFDLNGDRRPEVVVYLVGSYICGTGGCNLLVFRNESGEYRLVSESSIVNQPVVVSTKRTRGWNDLIVFVAGGGAPPRHATLRFNGRTYPDNPSSEPSVPKARIRGTEIISDDITGDAETGIALRPAKGN